MQAMNRILQPAFYEFRGHHDDDPTPWEYGFEWADFVNDRYTLAGLDIMTIGSDDLVRIAMISESKDNRSRLPMLLMKDMFDRFDCARAIRFTTYMPSDTSFLCDDLMSIRDYTIRNMSDDHLVETHCDFGRRGELWLEFDVYVYYRMIDGAMKGSPATKGARCHYPSVRFRRISPLQVDLEIALPKPGRSQPWLLPRRDIVRRLQWLCDLSHRLDGIRASIPRALPAATLAPLTELVDSLATKRRKSDKKPEWETTDEEQLTIRLNLLPEEKFDPTPEGLLLPKPEPRYFKPKFL